MPDVIELAANGRAKCRACGKPTEKGVLRFGERGPNPFAEGEGELTYWFHVDCAAYRRCERFVALEPAQLEGVDNAAALTAIAAKGNTHQRLARVAGLERAKSGRAKCRHCKETIDADTMRVVLSFWEEGRFSPAGFLHLTCTAAYCETTEVIPWLRFVAPEETAAALDAIKAANLTG